MGVSSSPSAVLQAPAGLFQDPALTGVSSTYSLNSEEDYYFRKTLHFRAIK